MASPDHRIPFALDKHGNIASIEEVENGAACACTCPSCSAPLIARQSKTGKTVWHFAHAKGYGCSEAFESSLHLGVKRIIEDAGWLELPECNVLRYRTSSSRRCAPLPRCATRPTATARTN